MRLTRRSLLSVVAATPFAMPLVAVPLVAKPAAGQAKKDISAITEARERVTKADDQIKKLKFKEATLELEKAVTILEGQHAFIDFKELTEAYLNLAVAYIRLGQDSEGEKLLVNVARLDPDTKLDTEKYPPVFVNTFEKMARKAKKGKRGVIQVEGAAGATVFLDGREVGKAPLKIKEVVKGTHYLRATAPGGDVWADRVDVAPEETAKVAVELGSGGGGVAGGSAGPIHDIVAALTANLITDAVLQKALAVAAESQADFVILGGVHKDGEEIVATTHLLKVANKKFTLLQKVKFDAEMLGAGIEIYKVGADVSNKVEVFGEAETMPAKVAKDAMGKPAAAAAITEVEATSPGSREPAHPEIVKRDRGDGERPRIAAAPVKREPEAGELVALKDDKPLSNTIEQRTISAKPASEGIEPIAPIDEIDKDKKPSTSSAWIWIVVGAVVLGGGAAGGFLYLNNASKPVTGKASISW